MLDDKKIGGILKPFSLFGLFLFAFLFFGFKANAVEYTPGQGIITYSSALSGAADANKLSMGIYSTDPGNPGSFGTLSSISVGSINPVWVVSRASPARKEVLVGKWEETNGQFEMLRWTNNSTWSLEWTENRVGSVSLDTKAFGMAYENSGEAVVAWAKTKGTTGGTQANDLEYRVWDGSNWTASQSHNIGLSINVASISWIEMWSHPATGSFQNDITLCFVTGSASFATPRIGPGTGCLVWDGDNNQWGDSKLIETRAEDEAIAGDTKTVDGFYEQGSGDFIAISGNRGSANATYTTWDGSNWNATASYAFLDPASYLDCSPMPWITGITNNQAQCLNFSGKGVDDVDGGDWSGSAWGTASGRDTGSLATSQLARRVGSSAWLVNGTSQRVGAFVYGESADAALACDRYDDVANTWGACDGPNPIDSATLPNFQFVSNPYLKNYGVILVADSTFDLHAYAASISGSATVQYGIIKEHITQDGSVIRGMPADFSFFNYASPTFTHFRWYNDDGAPGSATARAAEDIKASGSAALAINSTYRLRTQISNEGPATVSLDKFRLEFTRAGTSCVNGEISPGWTWRPLKLTAETASDAFDLETSAHFTDGASVSAALTASDPNPVNGYAISARASTGFQTLNGNNYADFEWNLKPNSNANTSASYCFRTGWITDESTNPDTRASMSYSKIASASVQASLGSTFTQNNYQWRYNADNIDPAGAIATENNSASIFTTQPVRLRTNVTIGTANLDASSQAFKLKYSTDLSNWTDIGSTTSFETWRFYENPSVAHGTTVSSTLLLTGSDIRGVYHASNSMPTNPNSANTTQDIEYDFSLDPARAQPGTTYYFRMFENDNNPLSTYTNNPTILIANNSPPPAGGGGGSSGSEGQGGGGSSQSGGGQGGGGSGGVSSGNTGNMSPTTSGDPTNSWTSGSNAYSSNESRTTLTGASNFTQDYATFGLSVPAGATINGIEVSLEAREDSNCDLGNDCQIDVSLSWNAGSDYTSVQSVTSTTLTQTDAIYTLGGSSNIWGRSWSDTEFSNTNFRLRLTGFASGSPGHQLAVDHVQVRVYYTTAGGGSVGGGGSGSEGQSGGGSSQGGGGSGGGGGGSPVMFDWWIFKNLLSWLMGK